MKGINLKSYKTASTALRYSQEQRRRKKALKYQSDESNRISSVVKSFLGEAKKCNSTQKKKLRRGKNASPPPAVKTEATWVRLKSAQLASYSLVEKRAVEDTKSALEAFQRKRFRAVKNLSNEETFEANDADNKKEAKETICHAASLLDEIHGYWQDQENVQLLTKLTGFDGCEIRRLFLNFKSLCSLSDNPCGITYHTFTNAVPTFTFEDPLFSNRVFEFFDTQERGIWRWEEYLLCMSLLFKTCKVLQTVFMFKLYDVNNDGTISKDEIFNFFIKSLVVQIDAHLLELCETHIDELFKRIDEDNDGEISLQETLLFVEKHPEIDDIFGIFGRTIALQNLKPKFDEYQDNSLDAVDQDEVEESRQEKYEKWKVYREKEKIAPSHTKRDTKLFAAIRNRKLDLNVLWDQLTQSIEIGTNSKARQEIDRRLDKVKLDRGVGFKMQK